ncbi:MAG: hypothetical protein KTR27_16310 [Leptolyngbyaceae cyanobacterium MAG.088]|nr:hypothetical protein [Leptolyngbyaceae cyanobacterium MAG.088]
MKAAIDNIALIKKFLKGEDVLLANRELRVEKALDEIQLLTTQGILVAKGQFLSNYPKLAVRLESDYWQVIHQLALGAGFIPPKLAQEKSDGATFAKYEHYSIPEGYQLHCQEASTFWKTWWVNHRKLQLMDMMLLCKKRWYPVTQVLCDTGTIYVKTWRGEQTLAISDIVVWLDRNTHGQRSRAQVRKHHNQTQVGAASSSQVASAVARQAQQPLVPPELQQVIQADVNGLIVHTVLGPVIIGGQNLTCKRARKTSRVS